MRTLAYDSSAKPRYGDTMVRSVLPVRSCAVLGSSDVLLVSWVTWISGND
jgi:hypothetical protein